jgi:3-oxoacyl-[acyl-carrier protein] reductase
VNKNVAIVTGAARGIGASIARHLKEQGYRVAALDLEGTEYRCDVGQPQSIDAALDEVESKLGTPTVLVNNAGVGGPFHRIDEVSTDEWDWIFSTNVKSVFYFSKLILPKMKALGTGRIVNIASIQGLVGAAQSSTYVASKHAMIGYTRAIAAEWGEYGITCNAVCPGYVDTKMGIQPDQKQDYLKQVLARSPVKRIATPDEIATLVGFLVTPSAAYLNGSVLVADGGITASLGI